MKRLSTMLLFLALASTALAHGDEDHGQGPASAAPVSNGVARIETATESFELVGQLQDDALSVYVDQFDTNAPVLNGKLDAELSNVKAAATFRADRGDYLINDAAFMKELTKPGKHAIVFTINTAQDSDLLEGTLDILPATVHDEPSRFPWTWVGAGLAGVLLALFLLAAWMRRARTTTGR
ncbi:hypothetical protein EGT07_24915 [Herbaspirillum sp. HC18]|nr:hypothetical protein EGT07_24915 [Herbaspirillum sp. HC18]